MVLVDEKIIYIHIPKTGGVSVEDFLLTKYNKHRGFLTFTGGADGQRFNFKGDGFETLYPIMHFTLPWIQTELANQNIIVDDTWTIFSIVRNPYYKLISALFFSNLSPFQLHYHTLPKEAQRILFDECWSEFVYTNNNNYKSNHILPQYKFLTGTNLQNVQIFKFEEGLENIMNNLGFKVNNDFPHKMDVSKDQYVPKPNYKDIITRKFVTQVNVLYKKDFEIFGYEMLEPRDFPE